MKTTRFRVRKIERIKQLQVSREAGTTTRYCVLFSFGLNYYCLSCVPYTITTSIPFHSCIRLSKKPFSTATARYFNSAVASTVPNRIIVIIMGKKSKANRKKAPVATSAATATVAAAAAAATPVATATAAVAMSEAAAAAAAITTSTTGDYLELDGFPDSTFFVKGKSFRKKGNHAKAQKIFLQGIENGCVPCLNTYTRNILYEGAPREILKARIFHKDNMFLHLALPLLLEGAIRGSAQAISALLDVYDHAICEEENVFGHYLTAAAPIFTYWKKHFLKNCDLGDDRSQLKQSYKGMKEDLGTECSLCGKHDSETVTLMKCEGCHLHFYCSKECQQKMWVEGQHAGACRQLGILQKYHKPFAKKIWENLVVHQMPPKDIPELQELRRQLGLSRPRADYQDLLEAANKQQLDQNELILPRNNGTVQIGSFPRPI